MEATLSYQTSLHSGCVYMNCIAVWDVYKSASGFSWISGLQSSPLEDPLKAIFRGKAIYIYFQQSLTIETFFFCLEFSRIVVTKSIFSSKFWRSNIDYWQALKRNHCLKVCVDLIRYAWPYPYPRFCLHHGNFEYSCYSSFSRIFIENWNN